MLSWEEFYISSEYVGTIDPVIVYLASFPKIKTLNKLQSMPIFIQLRDGIPFYIFFFNQWKVQWTPDL